MKVSLLLFIILIASAISLVTARHESRKLVNELENERNISTKIQEHKRKLVAEQSTLKSPERIERFAKKKLKMKQPNSEDIILLSPSLGGVSDDS
jgi:cell division protein FtsL